jgi:14-3-3 protein epsilon
MASSGPLNVGIPHKEGGWDWKTGVDLDRFRPNFKDERKNLVFMARTAETAERYDDMCKFRRALVEWTDKSAEKVDLTVEERNLLSVAYKNVIGARRASWRTLNVDEHKDDELIRLYKKQVETELDAICKDVLDLLTNVLVANCVEENESRVFYLKMTGDYFRYLAEFITDQAYDRKAADMYARALEIANKKLAPTHPIRLGLALNYSVCFYEILKDKQKACDLAKTAFDLAIAKLDKLDEANYKDSTLIMQLLRDNLTLWTADQGDTGADGNIRVEDVEPEQQQPPA